MRTPLTFSTSESTSISLLGSFSRCDFRYTYKTRVLESGDLHRFCDAQALSMEMSREIFVVFCLALFDQGLEGERFRVGVGYGWIEAGERGFEEWGRYERSFGLLVR